MLSVLRFYHWFSGTELEFWEEGACITWEQLDAKTAVFLWLWSQMQSQYLLSICVSHDHRRELDGMMIANLTADFVCTKSYEYIQRFSDFACIPHMACRVEIVKYVFFKPHCSLQDSKQSKTFHRCSTGVLICGFLFKYMWNQEFSSVSYLTFLDGVSSVGDLTIEGVMHSHRQRHDCQAMLRNYSNCAYREKKVTHINEKAYKFREGKGIGTYKRMILK